MLKETEIVSNFIEDRPVLKKHNTPSQILELLQGEVDELKASFETEQKHHWGRELADVVYFALSFAHMTGIDLSLEFAEKSARNYLKYPADQLQEGDFTEIRKRLKAEWDNGGDESFYGEDL